MKVFRSMRQKIYVFLLGYSSSYLSAVGRSDDANFTILMRYKE